MHVFYLHGFASSAQSKKATYFADRLQSFGVTLQCPDFNAPDFSSLTTTRMLEQVAQQIDGLDNQPIVLIGSSLGAVVALLTAARMSDRVTQLVLLAPALSFPQDGSKVLGPERFAQWRRDGALDVFHFAYGGMRRLNYAFYEDSLQYDAASADVSQPVRIFQGRRDQAVDYRVVEAYAAARPHVRLSLLDDDHQLMASLPRIWDDTATFLGLT
jgi:pimeloyl-ACP methyl ester carboxylesterase